MTAQPSVLQVVILRDGLLVGTEVFVPGSFTVGSSPQAEIKLDDPAVEPLHAVLYFQNGRSAIQDNNSRGGLYVNGHRVRACEVRSQDEILVGPFVLKTRVVTKSSGVQRPAPSPEVAALLGGPSAPSPAPVAPAPPAAPPPRPGTQPFGGPGVMGSSGPTVPSVRATAAFSPTVPGTAAPPPAARPPQDPGTVLSARRNAALAAAPHLRPVEPWPQETEQPTESILIPGGDLDDLTNTAPNAVPYGQQPTSPGVRAPLALQQQAPSPAPAPAPAKPKARAAARRAVSAPKLPAVAGKGAPRLYFELYWGETRHDARSFGVIPEKKPVLAAPTDGAAVPLWGFSLPEDDFVLAESAGESYRVFVPPGAVAEKQGSGSDAFYPVAPRELETEGKRRFLTLANGMAARLSEGEMSLVAYVAPPPEKLRANPLRGLPWLAITNFVLLLGGVIAFLIFGPKPRELPDFTAQNLPPVAVKLMMPEPEKKQEAQKKLEQIKERAEKAKKDKPVEKKEAPKPKAPEKAVASNKPPPPESKALKALAKLTAAGPASNDVLAAIDKMGSGPGSKKSKDFKLSGLVGKDPIANAGLGTFGLGGGGKGGKGTKGMELLNGAGGGGIGALGAAGFGKGGHVGGTVSRASSRSIAAQGSIDREAVAKVINSHLQEVRGCYERALLKDPGLAGKAVLEWSISTSGSVTSAKTKSSSLRNGEVEGCILRAIKSWRFPPARGGQVIITYPFVFNSVGY